MESGAGDNKSQKDTILTINISSSVFSAILFLLGGVISAILITNLGLGLFLPTRKFTSGTTELSTLPNTEVQKFDYGLRNWPVSPKQKASGKDIVL